jgi:hypothetical protein
MYQILVRVISRYAPVITLPVAVVLGCIGYNIEKIFPRKPESVYESVHEKREKRILDELSGNVHDNSSQSMSVLDRNQASNLK